MAKDTAADWAKAITIWAFMSLWIYFFVASLVGAGCHKLDRSPEERLRSCRKNLAMTGFFLTEYQLADNTLNQGIALAEIGELAQARVKFENTVTILAPTLKLTCGRAPYSMNETLRVMQSPDIPTIARQVWRDTLSEYEC